MAVSTPRVVASLSRLKELGGRSLTIHLQPEAAAALDHLRDATGLTTFRAVIEHCLLKEYHRVTRKVAREDKGRGEG